MRKAAVFLAVVVAVAAFAAAAVPRVVSLEAHRPRIVAAIGEKTGRTASFSKISLRLFPAVAVRLESVSVSGPATAPAELLLSAPVADLRLSVLSLLRGRVECSTLRLQRPSITIRERADGSHSASDVLERLSGAGAPRSADTRLPVPAGPHAVRIDGATLTVLRGGDGSPPSRVDISPVSFRVAGIGAQRKSFSLEFPLPLPSRGAVRFEGSAVRRGAGAGFAIRGEGKAAGQAFRVEGSVQAPNRIIETDLSVTFPKVKFSDLPESFPHAAEFLSRRKPQGYAKISAKVSGDLRSLGFEIEADLTRTAWTVVPGGLSKFIDAPCTLVVEGHRFPDAIVVSNAELRYPPLLLVGNAAWFPATGGREYAASGRISSLAEFAKSRGEQFAKWAPAGRLVVSIAGRRPTFASDDAYRIEADLAEAGVTVPGRGVILSGFSGHMSVDPSGIEFSPLSGLLNGQRLFLRGRVARGEAHKSALDLHMGYVDLASLFPGPEPGRKGKREKSDELSERLAEAWNRDLSFTGTVSIEAGNLWGVEFSNLTGAIRHDKGALSFEGVRCALYGGEVTLSGGWTGPGIDPGLKVRISMRNVEAGEIVRSKSDLRDFLSGKVTLEADVAGSRKDLPAFLRTVTGDGSFRITDGTMKGVNYPALASVAAGGKEAATGDTPFHEISSRVAFRAGKAHLSDLRVGSAAIELLANATIGLADHTLELVGTLWIRGERSKAPPWSTGGYFRSVTGEIAVPLVVSGTLRTPAVAIDPSAVGRTPGKMLRGGAVRGGKR